MSAPDIAARLDEIRARADSATADELRDDLLASVADVPRLLAALRRAVEALEAERDFHGQNRRTRSKAACAAQLALVLADLEGRA